MAEFLDQFLNKRRPRPSASSDETVSSPETKKSKQSTSPIQSGPLHEDEVMTALNMSQDLAATLKSILEKLEKLDVIESSLKKIESKLENLERRTEKLEVFQATAKKDIDDLKSSLNFSGEDLKEKVDAFQKVDTLITDLSTKAKTNEDMINEIYTKNLYLEAYSRRENIKFMNIPEEPTTASNAGSEDTEKIVREFLERELGFADAHNVEIQRVHRVGKSKEGKPRPILARFLRYKDVQQIFSLGRRLKDTDFQIFQDLPTEIINRRKRQMETFKEAKKRGIPAYFSKSQPDKLFVRGKLWPVGKPLGIS